MRVVAGRPAPAYAPGFLRPPETERMRARTFPLLVLPLLAVPAAARTVPACTPIELPATAQLLGAAPSIPLWVYGMMGDGTTDLGFGGPAPDNVQIEFYDPATGAFHLGDETNFATCTHCLLIAEDIQSDGITPLKAYFQSAGTLTVTTPPGAPAYDIGLSGVRLVEVTIDPGTSESTPVEGGACYEQAPADGIFADGFEEPPATVRAPLLLR